jgi:DNA-binding transcriptional regulator GbsR (MarR family)
LIDKSYADAKQRFLDAWGDMGTKWGINKAMAQIHGVLMLSEKPLSTDDVMKELGISRGNANTNLRALIDWGMIRRVFVKGDRKEYFESEKDVWKMFCTVARERKRREIEPAITVLQECLVTVKHPPDLFKERLESLLDILRTIDLVLGQLSKQENNSVLPRILKLLA